MSGDGSDILNLKGLFKKVTFSEKVALCLSTWFGVGLLPAAPGTFGTLAALPLVLLLKYLGVFVEEIVTILLIPLSVWASELSRKSMNRDDPSEVVIDEVAGLFLTFFLLPVSWLTVCAGFFLFRLFDILKPFPIRWLDQTIRGGIGIVFDDLLAGIYANLSLRLLSYFIS
ncbi:MAG: phosphatidylglycerophosphatase A [Pseudomonadota bacterium]